MKILRSAQARELDTKTIESGSLSGFKLMERAGIGATLEILHFIKNFYPDTKSIIILAGKGNNGGDGYVVARELLKSSFNVCVFMTADPSEIRGDAASHLKFLPKEICEFRKEIKTSDFPPKSIIVDALLGTGLSGSPAGKIAEWIKLANSSRRPIIALDIPSGLDSDTGEAYSPCIRADMTITFGVPKRGLFLKDGLTHSGILRFIDIGIPRRFIENLDSDLHALTSEEASILLPRHPQNCNKYSKGTLAIFAGSKKYSGAPALAASSALASGAGFVSLVYPKSCEIRKIEKAIVRIAVPADGGTFCPSSINNDFISTLKKADAICVGPGITNFDAVIPVVNFLWQSPKKAVFDADALTIIASRKLERRQIPAILTPHDGEMKRLIQGYAVNENLDRAEQVSALAKKTGSVILLKGVRTIIASPDAEIYMNMSGSNLLASAGTGDVLAGLIASFCAQGLASFQAAILGAYIHGKAAEINGNTPFSADTLVENLAQLMNTLKF